MISDKAKEKCIAESIKHHNTIRVNTLAFKQVFHPVTVTGEKRKDAAGNDVKHGHSEKGEVFTPTELVLEILEQLPDQVWEEGKIYLDPTCGNGQFLAAVLIIKMEMIPKHKNTLSTIYGVDIMQDNVDECRQRLIDIAGDTPSNWKIVRNNIRCEDGLKYDYSFEPIKEESEMNDVESYLASLSKM